jgi:hypothetical protein
VLKEEGYKKLSNLERAKKSHRRKSWGWSQCESRSQLGEVSTFQAERGAQARAQGLEMAWPIRELRAGGKWEYEI